MSELKPCPCGRSDVHVVNTGGGLGWGVHCFCGWTVCRQESEENAVNLWNTRHTDEPKLPRVSPENLVEGEWYVVKIKKKTAVLQAEKRGSGFVLLSRHYFSEESCTLSDNEAVYGPLPKFEIEEQA